MTQSIVYQKYYNNYSITTTSLFSSCPLAMTTRLPLRAVGLLTLLCTILNLGLSDNPDPSAPEQGVTFSHVYKIDVPGSSSCKVERQDGAGQKYNHSYCTSSVVTMQAPYQSGILFCRSADREHGQWRERHYLQTQHQVTDAQV